MSIDTLFYGLEASLNNIKSRFKATKQEFERLKNAKSNIVEENQLVVKIPTLLTNIEKYLNALSQQAKAHTTVISRIDRSIDVMNEIAAIKV